MRVTRFVALLTLAAAAPAHGRTWPDAGGWEITEGQDYCGMSLEYEGPGATELHLLKYLDGSVQMGVANYGWSTNEQEKYPLEYVLNGSVYNGGTSLGLKLGMKKGFTTKFGSDFIDDFRAGQSLHIYNGDTLVDQLSLEGTAAGLAMADRCLARVKAERAAEARERAHWQHIPKDPFADTKPESEDGSVPTPRGDLRAIISADDYPPAAIRNSEQGTTSYRLTVGSDGRVSDCQIVASSGSATLDSTTCRLIRSRARFTPARDAHGDSIEGYVTGSFRWTLQ